MTAFLSPRVLAGLAVTLVFLGLLLRHTDLDQLQEAVSGVEPVWLVLAAAAYFPGVWCRAARWRALLSPLQYLPVARLYPVVVIGYMVNDLVPLRAGELARAALLRRNEGTPPAATLATIGVERLTDGLTLLLFAAAAAVALPLDEQIGTLVRGAALLFAVATLAVLALAVLQNQVIGLAHHLRRTLPQSGARLVQTGITHLEHAFTGLGALKRPGVAIAVAGWAIAAWVGELGVFWLVAVAFGMDAPLAVLALAMATSNLATSIPASQGGVGPFEYFCAQTLLLFGVAPAIAIGYALVVHMVLILPVVLAGLYHLWRQGLAFREVLPAVPAPRR